MNSVVRPLSLVLLCFALIASSATMAVARGQAAALSRGGTTVVICSGYGVVTVALDADGNPIGPVHACPDCLAGLAAYLSPGPLLALPLGQQIEAVKRIEPAIVPRLAPVWSTRARGPPVLV